MHNENIATIFFSEMDIDYATLSFTKNMLKGIGNQLIDYNSKRHGLVHFKVNFIHIYNYFVSIKIIGMNMILHNPKNRGFCSRELPTKLHLHQTCKNI